MIFFISRIIFKAILIYNQLYKQAKQTWICFVYLNHILNRNCNILSENPFAPKLRSPSVTPGFPIDLLC